MRKIIISLHRLYILWRFLIIHVSLKQNERHPDKVYSDKLFLGMVQKQ